MTKDWRNQLYFGDNLDILPKYIADEPVDLILLDGYETKLPRC